MKRLLLLLVALVLIVSAVAGCGSSVNTYIDPNEIITLSVGDEFYIAMDRVADEGYIWSPTYDRAILQLTDEEYKEEYKEEGLSGPGGTHYCRFRVLKTGTTEIALDYKHPLDTIPTWKISFRVTVE